MKAFLSALIVSAGIAAGADYLLGGPLFESGGVLLKTSAQDVYRSDNVRLN